MRVTLLIFAILFAPSAHASTTWLLGAQIGPSLRLDETRYRPRFRFGVGLDALHDTGRGAALRLDAFHDLELRACLRGGWAGSGVRTARGLPFVLHIGPVFSRERTGAWRAGGSAALGYALWRARALMELQLDVTRGFTRVPARDTEVPWAMTLSLVLRAVPLTPWSTGH